MEVPEEVRDRIESHPNVVGTMIGPKRVNDRATDEECLIALVSEKVPRTQLDDEAVVPEEVEIDGERIRTDVQEVGDVRPQTAKSPVVRQTQRREDRWRPTPAGVSAGHPDVSAGTLGSPPLLTADGETVALTNAHVAAPVGDAAEGDPFLQPGPADGGNASDRIGELLEWSDIAPDAPNETDSALVAVEESKLRDDLLDIGRLAGFERPDRDATFTKSGRTTGVTTGELRGRDARIRVGGYYDEPVVFEGVDAFGPMSAAGDSGSVIGIERAGGFYGTNLLFAGSDRVTFGVPLSTVQAEHGDLSPAAPNGGGGDGGGGDGGRNNGDDSGGTDEPNSLLGRLIDFFRSLFG
jgi:hypothetical protein